MKLNKHVDPSLIEQKVYKKREQWKDYKRKRNLKQNSRKKEKKNGKKRWQYRDPPKEITLRVPERFSLLENTEEVLRFAEDCKQIRFKDVQRLGLDFTDVVDISEGAMALMLSIIHDLNGHNITVGGTIPADAAAKERFIQSGFLDFFSSSHKRNKHKNTILVNGGSIIDQASSAPEVQDAMETVFGKKTRNQKLQGMIIEMMTNSVNHAFNEKRDTKWYFSIFHEEAEKKVKFCFVDNGAGIIKTIRRKFTERIPTLFNGEEIIKKAFNGDYGSRTRLPERGTGLLTIKSNLDENIITNLRVITNNFFYDFKKQTVTELVQKFNGTFYFWELDETCKNVNYKSN
jgi:anti-sigma regulatory factor (Ser/Thr protein kinase)